jgi:ATP-dependent Clp protease ATP-binding subunit ClpC
MDDQSATSRPAGKTAESIYALAARVDPKLTDAAHPRDVLEDGDFKKGVVHLEQCTEKELVQYALGNNWAIACLAAEGLSRREISGEAADKLIGQLHLVDLWVIFFVLRALAGIRDRPLVGPVLAQAQEWWKDNPLMGEVLGEFVAKRRDSEPRTDFAGALSDRSSQEVELIESVLAQLDPILVAPLRKQIDGWRLAHADIKYLRSLGRFYTEQELRKRTYQSKRFANYLTGLRESLSSEPPQSVLLVGESGVGKTALRLAFAAELRTAGWAVFETSATYIIAGKKYIGEIEQQLKRLLQNLQIGKRIALFIDRLNELQTAGRTTTSPQGVLDQLWPAIERRELFLLSEVTPSGYLLLRRAHPSLASVLKVMRIEAADEAESLVLAERFLADIAPQQTPAARSELARESVHLARQYLTYKAAPGGVFGLLSATVKRLHDRNEHPFGRVDLLATITQLTGLPEDVLDERATLRIADLESLFTRQVIGQPEAVACLVERIAMLKAGLTDTARPIGVFLFAGPTGTGKTEIAKTLAEILFGAPERMIRLDMSEYQAADSVERLLADSGELAETQTLVQQIRKNPFSVLLLDEFEKAHASVWDIFLQVFDDGRLTDVRGNLADFRHCIVILTSNLGATIGTGAGIGFTSTSDHFAPAEVTRAIERTFRKEFINRLDRVVIFQPLGRQVMRQILRKELDRVLVRRGFRIHDWAVEWEDSSLEFLLDRGFTPDLGARPLRRAIDRYLLAPLSFTIVEHQFPEGEQFLFVRSDGEQIQVAFVDPDAEPAPAATGTLTTAPDSLGTLVMDSRGSVQERQLLLRHAEPLLARMDGERWQHRKQSLLDSINESDFWGHADRYKVLDQFEQMDRIETAAGGLRSLLERLDRSPGSRQLSADVAEKLYLLETACADLDGARATQAFLELSVHVEGDATAEQAFLRRLTGMYEGWARKRRMKWKLLRTENRAKEGIRLFAVAGFGAYTILAPEHGLHVFEIPRSETAFDRVRVRVRVAPQSHRPPSGRDGWLAQAHQALAIVKHSTEIVRRYREHPSPLVRDNVHGWRTGRLGRVLDGDFDLFCR